MMYGPGCVPVATASSTQAIEVRFTHRNKFQIKKMRQSPVALLLLCLTVIFFVDRTTGLADVPLKGITGCGTAYKECTKAIKSYRAGNWGSYCNVRVTCATCRYFCGAGLRLKYSERCRTRLRKFNYGKCCRGAVPLCWELRVMGLRRVTKVCLLALVAQNNHLQARKKKGNPVTEVAHLQFS